MVMYEYIHYLKGVRYKFHSYEVWGTVININSYFEKKQYDVLKLPLIFDIPKHDMNTFHNYVTLNIYM